MNHISSGLNAFSICFAGECKGCEPDFHHTGHGEITRWLRYYGADRAAMIQLRHLVDALGDANFLHLSSDTEVIERIGAMIAAGRLRVCGMVRAKRAVNKIRTVAPPAPAPPPAGPAPRPKSQPTSQPGGFASGATTPDPDDTFGDSLEVANMVAVLVEAAQLGVPFCEECARAAAARAAA